MVVLCGGRQAAGRQGIRWERWELGNALPEERCGRPAGNQKGCKAGGVWGKVFAGGIGRKPS